MVEARIGSKGSQIERDFGVGGGGGGGGGETKVAFKGFMSSYHFEKLGGDPPHCPPPPSSFWGSPMAMAHSSCPPLPLNLMDAMHLATSQLDSSKFREENKLFLFCLKVTFSIIHSMNWQHP